MGCVRAGDRMNNVNIDLHKIFASLLVEIQGHYQVHMIFNVKKCCLMILVMKIFKQWQELECNI